MQAANHAAWRRVSWKIEGHEVEASVWDFAGVWTGFSVDLPDSYIVLVGVGVDPDGLSIVPVTDGAPYKLDLQAEIDRAWPSMQSREWDLTALSKPNRFRFHPDQLRVASLE